MTTYNAFEEIYHPTNFPVFCDHSVLETTVEGIGTIRVCNGMELSNPTKGLNQKIPPKTAEAISNNLELLNTLTTNGFEAIKAGLQNAAEQAAEQAAEPDEQAAEPDEQGVKLITITGNFPPDYKTLIGTFAKNNAIKLNGNGDEVNKIVLGELGFEFGDDGKATGLIENSIFQSVFDAGIIPVLMEDATVSSESPSDILVANLNKSLDTLSSNYIKIDRFDKYFILLGELFQLQNMGGFKTPGNIYNGELNLAQIMSHIVVGEPDVVVMVEPFDTDAPNGYSSSNTSEGTGLLVLKKGDGVTITHNESNYNEYTFEIGGKKILAVHSKVDPNKDSLEEYLNGMTEEVHVVCGDFNLTKSKGGNNISEVNPNNFSKIVPSFQVRKEKHDTNVIMNNQMHKSGVTDEMDGMAIFVRKTVEEPGPAPVTVEAPVEEQAEPAPAEDVAAAVAVGEGLVSIGGGGRRTKRSRRGRGKKGLRKTRKRNKSKRGGRGRRSKRGRGRGRIGSRRR